MHALLSLLVAAPVALAFPQQGLQQGPQEGEAPSFAARAVGQVTESGGYLTGDRGKVTFADLEDVIIWRDGNGPNGQAALRQLLELRVLESLATEHGIVVTEAQLADRFDQLDVEARQSGVEGGLATYIEQQGVDPAEFRRFLRLSMIHEILTRRGLGLPDDRELTADQQQLWLEKTLKERGYEQQPHPWSGGVVCVSGDVTITRDEFGEYLRRQVDDADEREACFLILMERAVRARMPEVTAEGAEKALDREVERRRAEAEADPRYQGASYEQLLNARGLSIEAVRRDPAIRAASLAHEAIDRAHDEASLRAEYDARRDEYDGKFGEAVEIRILFMNATDREDDPLRRKHVSEVSAQLAGIKVAIDSPATFVEKVELYSEDRASRENGGLIGYLTRAGASEDFAELRRKAFAAVDADPENHGNGTVIGPVRLTNGLALALIGERQPSPTWNEMRDHVHQELRRRFLEETLDRASVVTYLDVQ